MGKVQSSKELMKYISKMDHENSVFEFYIPGKGRFILVLQEENGIYQGLSRVIIKKFRIYYEQVNNDIVIVAILFPGEN